MVIFVFIRTLHNSCIISPRHGLIVIMYLMFQTAVYTSTCQRLHAVADA